MLLLCAVKLGARRGHLRAGIAALAALSALEMALLYSPGADPSRLYYGTDTRAFALLIGAFLATSTSGRRPRTSASVRDVIAAIAFAGLVLMVTFSNGFSAFLYYGGLVLCCVLTAAFIYGTSAPDSRIMRRIFSAKPLAWVGERSYGMYLWHYPIILLLTPANAASATPWWLMLAELALVLGVSALSYTYIETPVRHGALGKAWKKYKQRRANVAQIKNEKAFRPNPRKACAGIASLAVLTIAVAGIAFVPDTSIMSEEGAALLQNGAVATSGNPENSQQNIPEENSSANPILKEESAPPVPDPNDNRSEEQRAFDEKISSMPLPENAYSLLMIGDSVSLRTIPYFEEAFPTGHIDAELNRRLAAGLELYCSYADQGLVGNIVVFALGTNGYLTDGQIDEAMSTVGSEKAVWFLTVRNPYDGMTITNEALASAQERYPNIRVIDWVAASEGHEEYFDGDGTHLTDEGAQVYIGLIKEATKYEMPAA